MSDPVKGFTLDDTINSLLSECIYGVVDDDWELANTKGRDMIAIVSRNDTAPSLMGGQARDYEVVNVLLNEIWWLIAWVHDKNNN